MIFAVFDAWLLNCSFYHLYNIHVNHTSIASQDENGALWFAYFVVMIKNPRDVQRPITARPHVGVAGVVMETNYFRFRFFRAPRIDGMSHHSRARIVTRHANCVQINAIYINNGTEKATADGRFRPRCRSPSLSKIWLESRSSSSGGCALAA